MDPVKRDSQIEQIVPISTFLAHTQKIRGMKEFILSFFITKIEKHLHKRLYTTTPQALSDFSAQPSTLIEPAVAARRLQTNGIVTGILKNRRSYDDEPKLISFRAWSHADTPNIGYGSDLFNESTALWKAIGECQERFLWRYHDFYSKNSEKKSYSEITHKAINPYTLAGFSEKQKKESPGILTFDDNTIFSWTPVTPLSTPDNNITRTVLCPTQLLSNRYSRKQVRHPDQTDTRREPLLRWCITTGLASGSNKTDALVSGILEIIERDAFMVNYLNKLSPKLLDLSYLAAQDTQISQVLQTCTRYNLDVHVVQLATDFPVHVLLGVIKDKGTKGPALVVAASADFDLKTALLDTLSETLAVRRMARSLTVDIDPNKPHTFGQDHRVKYWSLPEQRDKLNFLLAGAHEQIDLPAQLTQKKTRHDAHELEILVTAFREKKYGLYYVDMSSSAKLTSGITTVNVISPEMHPLHLNESIPYLHSERLGLVPKTLGYTPSKKYNQEPHPFP